MLDELDLQACAEQTMRQYGNYADRAVGRRIAEYAGRNEFDGVAMWRAIGVRVNQLRLASIEPPVMAARRA